MFVSMVNIFNSVGDICISDMHVLTLVQVAGIMATALRPSYPIDQCLMPSGFCSSSATR